MKEELKTNPEDSPKNGAARGLLNTLVMPLFDLKRNDIVSLHYGFSRLTAKVLGNNGEYITWHSLQWLEDSAENYSYNQCELSKMTHIGTYRTFWKRLFTLNFSKVDFIA